jgi:uncharacterized protein YneF (UPF0154 family)
MIETIAIVAVVWLVLSLVVGVVFGRMISR